MTIGQRISQLRKEHHLSQEELGEKLGVSRQAIYKWESDSSLPEIEKLITLSRIFSVSVGWLLGVEELPEAKPEEASGELTEQQIKMIEEITSRYIDAQPKPRTVKHKKLIGAAAIALVIGAAVFLINLYSQLNAMENQYMNLQNNIGRIESNVNSSIAGISGRVEEVLKSQNNLTAEYSTEYVSTDVKANTVTIRARAIPKTYIEGMEAVFWVTQNGTKEITEVKAELGDKLEFSADIVCPLSDDMSVSVTFISGDKKESQFLDSYERLLYETLPWFRVDGKDLLWTEVKNGKTNLSSKYIFLREPRYDGEANALDTIKSMKVGVFKNQELVCWAEKDETMGKNENSVLGEYYKIPKDTVVSMGKDDGLMTAAVVTDIYGREVIVCGDSFNVDYENQRDESKGQLMWDSKYSGSLLNGGEYGTWKY